MLFILSLKLSSFSRYLNFCVDFLAMQKKRFDQKDKVNFKIYDVTAWLTNSYITHMAQYFTKQKQPDNEIWSKKYFSSKIMQKMRQGDQFQTYFCFLKKLYMSKSKWSAAQFQCILIVLNLAYSKNELYGTLEY